MFLVGSLGSVFAGSSQRNPMFTTKDIKNIVKDNTVHFLKFRQGYFYYWIKVETLTYFFPVPLSDIGDATLPDTEKAIIFMRYIRQAINTNTFLPLG